MDRYCEAEARCDPPTTTHNYQTVELNDFNQMVDMVKRVMYAWMIRFKREHVDVDENGIKTIKYIKARSLTLKASDLQIVSSMLVGDLILTVRSWTWSGRNVDSMTLHSFG